MKPIEMSSNSESGLFLIKPCAECGISFENRTQLKSHMMNEHIQSRRNGRALPYVLNKKRANVKLLKGATRENNLDVEVKSGCVNLRFSDGAYFGVVLPLLRDWNRNVINPFCTERYER